MWQPGAIEGGQATVPPAEMAPMSSYGAVEGVGPDDASMAPQAVSANAGAKADARELAMKAFGGVKADLVVTARDMPALLMPWALLCACMLPVALMKEPYLGVVAVSLCFMLGVGFLLFANGRPWQMLAVTCLASCMIGGLLGRYDRMKYLDPFFIYSRSPFFLNVLPQESPGVYQEAGYIRFSADSHVDTSRGLGYRSGSLWCVAPIMGAGSAEIITADAESVGFWAVGQDCCQERGLFRCGDVLQRKERGGLVVHDYGRTDDQMLPVYTLAAQAAAKTYGLMLPKNPIFVEWGKSSDAALDDMYGEAWELATTSVLCFFGVVPLFAFLLGLLGLSLTSDYGQTLGGSWHPDKVALMKYGLDISFRPYDREFQWDLLNMRCYWSGEVIYDYAFHVANKHMFLGCFLSHPSHPYTKLERFVVCGIVTCFILFPVGAISVALDFTGWRRLILIVLIVTVPYNILKLYLMQIAQQDSLRLLEEGQTQGPRRALQWEVAFLTTCSVATLCTCLICMTYIRSATETPLGDVLWSSCDALGFAFVLELLFDLVFPYIGVDKCEGTWTMGFFGRWLAERSAYLASEREAAAAAAEPSMARAMASSRGRPLFRGLGAEILLPEQVRQPYAKRPRGSKRA